MPGPPGVNGCPPDCGRCPYPPGEPPGRFLWKIGWPRWITPEPPGAPPACGPAEAAGALGGAAATGGAEYTGRGPVCGIITRRGAGTFAAGRGASLATGDSALGSPTAGASTAVAEIPAEMEAEIGAEITSGFAGIAAAELAAGAAATGASDAAGFTNTGAEIGGVEIAGAAERASTAGEPACTGGLATTGPLGGFAATARTGGGGATRIRGSWRGCGTIRRGATAAAASTAAAGLCATKAGGADGAGLVNCDA